MAAAPVGAGLRRWLTPVGVVLVLVILAPPLSTLARRYLFAESFQFSMLAMGCPALIAAGAPWHPLRRLARGPARRPLRRAVAAWHRQRPVRRAAVFVLAFAIVGVVWRLPPVLDALARTPGLAAAEAVTLLAAGGGLWLELTRPRATSGLSGLQRAAAAALAMWSMWIIAYALGFAGGPLVHAYTGGRLSVAADQQIAAGVVWGVAGLCLLPVIFAAVFSWLRDDDIGEELGQAFPGGPARAAVRGWDRPPRRRRVSR